MLSEVHIQLSDFVSHLVFLLGRNMINLSPVELYVRLDSMFRTPQNTHDKRSLHSSVPTANTAEKMLR